MGELQQENRIVEIWSGSGLYVTSLYYQSIEKARGRNQSFVRTILGNFGKYNYNSRTFIDIEECSGFYDSGHADARLLYCK